MSEKRQVYKVTQEGSLEQQYFETTASQVIEETNKNFMTAAERTKLGGVEAGAQANKIESISVNGTPQTISGKAVDLVVAIDAGTSLAYTASSGVLSLVDKDNAVLSSVDLPLELLVSSGTYNTATKEIELTLANGSEIAIDVADLIDEYTADETTLTLDTTNGNVFKLSATYQNKIDTASTKSSANETAIANIVGGATTVAKATTADKLASPKTLTVNGDVSGSVASDMSDNSSMTLTLANSGVTAGVYSVVQCDTKGRVTAGNNLIEFGTATSNEPSSKLAVGGLFIKLV